MQICLHFLLEPLFQLHFLKVFCDKLQKRRTFALILNIFHKILKEAKKLLHFMTLRYKISISQKFTTLKR